MKQSNVFYHLLFPWYFVVYLMLLYSVFRNVSFFRMFVKIMFRLSSQIWQIPILCLIVWNGLHILKKRNSKCIWLDQIVSKIVLKRVYCPITKSCETIIIKIFSKCILKSFCLYFIIVHHMLYQIKSYKL